MVKKILLNNSEFQFSIEHLPCLIHGKAHEGSSLFTVTLIASLYKQGYKVLFLSGYPMARQELIDQIEESRDTYFVDGNLSMDKAINSKIIFVQREHTDLYETLLTSLSDIDERVVLIKNIDLFDEGVYTPVSDHTRLVLSGDLDLCSFKASILEKRFVSTVLFSQPKIEVGVEISNLDKYEACFVGKSETKGIIKILS